MTKLMHVRNQIAGDRRYFEDRLAAYHAEVVAASERGERDRCPKCQRVSVRYSFASDADGEAAIFLAECESCGMIGG